MWSTFKSCVSAIHTNKLIIKASVCYFCVPKFIKIGGEGAISHTLSEILAIKPVLSAPLSCIICHVTISSHAKKKTPTKNQSPNISQRTFCKLLYFPLTNFEPFCVSYWNKAKSTGNKNTERRDDLETGR